MKILETQKVLNRSDIDTFSQVCSSDEDYHIMTELDNHMKEVDAEFKRRIGMSIEFSKGLLLR